MLELRSIRLVDVLSHKSTRLDFRPNQRLLLDGPSGSGKSGVCDAILFALYGRGRSDYRGMVRKGADRATVKLDLDLDGRPFTVERTVTSDGKHSLKVTEDGTPVEATGVKGHQEFIERNLTKASYRMFVNSVMHMQDGYDSFVGMSAPARKDLILEMAGATEFAEYYERARKELSATDNLLASEMGEMSVHSDSLKRLGDVEGRVKTTKNDHAHYKSREEKAKKGADAFVQAQFDFKSWSVQAFESQKRLKEAEADVTLAELGNGTAEELDSLRKAYSERMGWERAILELERDRPASVDYGAKLQELKRRMGELRKRKIENCPETGKPCALLAAETDISLAELKKQVSEVEADYETYARAMVEYSAGVKALVEPPTVDLERLSELTRASSENSVPLEAAVKSRQRALDDLDGAERHLKASQAIMEANRAAKAEYDSVRECSEVALTELSLALDAKRRYDESMDALNGLEASTGALARKADALKAFKEAVSPTGMVAMAVDSVMPFLEGRINAMLGSISDMTVSLDTAREGAGKDTVLEGLFIAVRNASGEECDYQLLSGGEKLKVTVAISEALAGMQKIGFRILDEVFVGLDRESTEGFARMMTALEGRCSQLIAVSHLQEIKELFNDVADVAKRDGISHLTIRTHEENAADQGRKGA